MRYPAFFDEIKPIVLKDELAGLLGAFEGGAVEFSYLDVVKSAGHSCPTVAGAYLMAQKGLEALYIGNRTPIRGEIKVEFKGKMQEGVTGVIANVFSQITGATSTSGFKGLTRRFNRTGLMEYGAQIEGDVRMTRIDSQRSVEISYDPSVVPNDPKVMTLMVDMEKNTALPHQKEEFAALWQQRVEKIFQNADKAVRVRS